MWRRSPCLATSHRPCVCLPYKSLCGTLQAANSAVPLNMARSSAFALAVALALALGCSFASAQAYYEGEWHCELSRCLASRAGDRCWYRRYHKIAFFLVSRHLRVLYNTRENYIDSSSAELCHLGWPAPGAAAAGAAAPISGLTHSQLVVLAFGPCRSLPTAHRQCMLS